MKCAAAVAARLNVVSSSTLSEKDSQIEAQSMVVVAMHLACGNQSSDKLSIAEPTIKWN